MAPLRRNTHKAQRQDAAVNLSATAAPRRRWAKVATYLAGVVSFPVLVVVTGAIVSLVVASVVAGGSEGSEVVPFLFWIVLTGIPVVLLLLRPGGVGSSDWGCSPAPSWPPR